MPVARYFLWVGGVLLALLFIADACLPRLPFVRVADASRPAIRIHSTQKWPERAVLDTSAPMPHVVAIASAVQADPPRVDPPRVDPGRPDPAPMAAAAIADHAREALAQLQPPVSPKPQAKQPRRQEVRHQQNLALRHVARVPPRIVRQQQYAWFSDRMWW